MFLLICLARSARLVYKAWLSTEMALRALLVHVSIFKLKVLFPYFTCNFGRWVHLLTMMGPPFSES